MKKYFATYILVLLSSAIVAQKTFQASIQPVPASAAVTVLVKTSAAKTGKPGGLTFAIAIPVSVGVRPSITVTFPNPNIALSVAPYNAINQDVAGVPHYIYNVLAEGNVTAAIPAEVYSANVDIPIATISFNGNSSVTSQIKLVNLPDGGTDPSPNSFFGFSIDGADVVNEAAMFYAIPAISTATNDGNGYSGTSYAQTTGAVPLPVKFLGFNAVKRDNDAVLTWQIENETAITDRYEIERSLSGTDFKKIATIAPKNNSSSRNSYDLTDHDLSSVRSSGVFYYRIKQIDKDSKFIYSDVKSVRLNSKGIVIGVYPNPVKGTAKLTVDMEQEAIATVSITDASGKQVQTLQVPLFKGANNKDINMTSLAAGSYILKVQTATEVKTIPVVKAN